MTNKIDVSRRILTDLILQAQMTGSDNVRCKVKTLQRIVSLLSSIADVQPVKPVMDDRDAGWNAALEALKIAETTELNL